MKLLMKLTDIFEDLEQIGPIKINHLDESGFHEAFPNIMHMFYEQTEVFDSCPHDIDGTINRENISPEDNNLYSLSVSLIFSRNFSKNKNDLKILFFLYIIIRKINKNWWPSDLLRRDFFFYLFFSQSLLRRFLFIYSQAGHLQGPIGQPFTGLFLII